jgi:hypothetical protein
MCGRQEFGRQGWLQMPRRSLALTFAFVLVALGSARLTAQTNPPTATAGRPAPRFGRGGFPPGPQDGIGFLGFEAGVNNKVVTGEPYSAQVAIEHKEVLADGNQIDRTSTTLVCRDGQGRTYREETLSAIGSYSASGNPPRAIFINDPVAGVAYVLDPVHKTARKFVLPSRRSGPGNTLIFQRGGSDPNSSTTSLGSKTMEGVLVQGTQFTRTIPAGRIGNAQPIQIVTTRWFSSELNVNVRTETSDPSRGHTITTLTNINRGEPDPSLFQLPADYTLQEAGTRARVLRPGLGAPPQ